MINTNLSSLYAPVAYRTRGNDVECVHSGAVVAVRDDGKVLFSVGSPEAKTFFRSSAKPFQALPLVESGAHIKYGFTTPELALTCASHNGEPYHTAAAQSMLTKLGLDMSALRCGSHKPYDSKSRDTMTRAGEKPSALHNNCSGKHSGMLASCLANGWDTASYLELQHPLQQRIFDRVSELSEVKREEISTGIDGCSVPTFFLPMISMARMFATIASGRDERLNTLASAMKAAPEMIDGTGEFDTMMMQAGGGKVVSKRGGAAIACAAISDGTTGIGIVAKSGDGVSDVPPVVMLRAIAVLGLLTPEMQRGLEKFIAPVQKNVNGWDVGKLVAAF